MLPMESLLILTAFLVVVSASIPAVTIHFAVQWRKREEARIAELRQKHLDDLAAAKQDALKARTDANEMKTRHTIALREMVLDSEALILACHELAGLVDEDTDELAFSGDWREGRKELRKMASRHNKEMSVMDDHQLLQLHQAYKVNVQEA